MLHMKPAHLVLHLVLTLVQVLVLETPLVLDMDVDVKLSGLSLSQLKQTNKQTNNKDFNTRLICSRMFTDISSITFSNKQ